MPKIIITKWEAGLNKAPLSMLQFDVLSIKMRDAVHNVEMLFRGSQIILECQDYIKANEFIIKAREMGAVCSLEE